MLTSALPVLFGTYGADSSGMVRPIFLQVEALL